MGFFFSDNSGKIERRHLDKHLKEAGVAKHVRDRIVAQFDDSHGTHIDKKELEKGVRALMKDSEDGISSDEIHKGTQSLQDRINDDFSHQ